VARIVVLGIGNSLRGDDGVGCLVAEAAAQHWPGRVVVRTGQQLLPEWAADLTDADVVYFVDASLEVQEAELRVLSTDTDSAPIDGHNLDPAQLLLLTRGLFGRAPRAFVLHVPAVNFVFGDLLSPTAATGVQRAIGLLRAAVGSIL
jgi:hydrogenase maturation protease